MDRIKNFLASMQEEGELKPKAVLETTEASREPVRRFFMGALATILLANSVAPAMASMSNQGVQNHGSSQDAMTQSFEHKPQIIRGLSMLSGTKNTKDAFAPVEITIRVHDEKGRSYAKMFDSAEDVKEKTTCEINMYKSQGVVFNEEHAILHEVGHCLLSATYANKVEELYAFSSESTKGYAKAAGSVHRESQAEAFTFLVVFKNKGRDAALSQLAKVKEVMERSGQFSDERSVIDGSYDFEGALIKLEYHIKYGFAPRSDEELLMTAAKIADDSLLYWNAKNDIKMYDGFDQDLAYITSSREGRYSGSVFSYQMHDVTPLVIEDASHDGALDLDASDASAPSSSMGSLFSMKSAGKSPIFGEEAPALEDKPRKFSPSF